MSETFSTLLAGEGTLSSVNSHVTLRPVLRVKHLPHCWQVKGLSPV